MHPSPLIRAAKHFSAPGLLFLLWPLAAASQVPTVLHGRVEDAVSREPVRGARVLASDSSTAVFTDSLGVFALPVQTDSVRAVFAEQYGYLGQRFDLEPDASARVSVLLLEPAPIALEGIEVVDDRAVTTILRRLENRRNAFGRSMSAFDRQRLERFAPAGSVLDFVRRRHHLWECGTDGTQLCTSPRVRTIGNPDTGSGILVCVDGIPSPAPVLELGSLDAAGMALIEIYGGWRPFEIRVYTPRHLAWRARTGQTQVLPLRMGC